LKLVRVLLVDDDEAVRDGITVLLSTQSDIEIVGETDNGQEALAMIANLKPDVVLLDICMPVDDGISIAKQIAEEFPETRVVIYSAMGYRAQEAISLGFKFLLKGCDFKELVSALRGEEKYFEAQQL